MTTLTVLNKYPLELMDGEATLVKGSPTNDLSYYQYVNDSRRLLEVGKNVQATMFCAEGLDKGLTWEEPFGGVGVFATAVQGEYEPSRHTLIEIDTVCYEQLCRNVKKDKENISVICGDANDKAASELDPAEVYLAEFPTFTMHALFFEGRWKELFERIIKIKPKRVIVTDGARFFWHLHWMKYNEYFDYKRFNLPTAYTSDPETYIRNASALLYSNYGYSITRYGHHSNCFYYALEPNETLPLTVNGNIKSKHFGSGTGPNGVRHGL
jgi:hypothetical protein